MGLLSSIGGLFGADSGKAQQQNIAQGLGFLGDAFDVKKKFGKGEKKFLKKALKAGIGGYDAALGEIGKAGLASKQSVLDQAGALEGKVASTLAGSGLYGSTIQGSLLQGISQSTTQQLANIDEQLAQIKANLQVGKGQAAAQGFGNLAAFKGNQGSALASILGGKADFLGNVSYQGGGGILSAIGGIADVGQKVKGLFG